MPIDLDYNDEAADWIKQPGRGKPRLLAECGDLYLLSLDGSTDETADAVVYRPSTRRVSHVAPVASHLKMLHGYPSDFSGTAEEGNGSRTRYESCGAARGQPPSISPQRRPSSSVFFASNSASVRSPASRSSPSFRS